MFPCFFSLNQCLSHSWTYSSSPSLFQKLQSRHQHFSFPHFFCIAEKYNLFCLLHLFICLYVSFLSVSTFFFYLSVSTFFFIRLYLFFNLSLSSFLSVSAFFLSVSTFFFICLTFFFICLYLLFCLSLPNNLPFLQLWFASFF